MDRIVHRYWEGVSIGTGGEYMHILVGSIQRYLRLTVAWASSGSVFVVGIDTLKELFA
jgi:hypothetical protein